MPTATPDFLLSHETTIELAWVRILTGASLTAQQEFTDVAKATPYVDVSLTNIRPTGQKNSYAERLYYSAWTGNLVTRVVTQRGTNSTQHAGILQTIRGLASNYLTVFAPQLPWHVMRTFREELLHRSYDAAKLLDITELTFHVDYQIKPSALDPIRVFIPL